MFSFRKTASRMAILRELGYEAHNVGGIAALVRAGAKTG